MIRAILFGLLALSSLGISATDGGEGTFEEDRCRWVLARIRDAYEFEGADVAETTVISHDDLVDALSGFEEKFATSIDARARHMIGMPTNEGVDYVSWNDFPSFNKTRYLYELKESLKAQPRRIRENFLALHEDPEGPIFPMVQFWLVEHRIAELRFPIEHEKPEAQRLPLFEGVETPSIVIVGAAVPPVQREMMKYLRKLPNSTPVVALTDFNVVVESAALQRRATVIRPHLQNEQNPWVKDGHLHFNTPAITAIGAYDPDGDGYMGATQLATAIQHALSEDRPWVELRVPLKYVFLTDSDQLDRTSQPTSLESHLVQNVAMAAAEHDGYLPFEKGAERRELGLAKLGKRLEEALLRLAIDFTRDCDGIRSSLSVTPPPNPLRFDYSFSFDLPRGKRVRVVFESPDDFESVLRADLRRP